MFTKPTTEIEASVLAEYDADYVGFVKSVFEDLERTNPQLADIFFFIANHDEDDHSFTLGLQMASAVYRQLQLANGGTLPIVEKREALQASAFEAIANPEAFVNKYGTPYFYNGLIGRRTIANFLGDAIGHNVGHEGVIFVAVFLIRLLEVQVELDCRKRPH